MTVTAAYPVAFPPSWWGARRPQGGHLDPLPRASRSSMRRERPGSRPGHPQRSGGRRRIVIQFASGPTARRGGQSRPGGRARSAKTSSFGRPGPAIRLGFRWYMSEVGAASSIFPAVGAGLALTRRSARRRRPWGGGRGVGGGTPGRMGGWEGHSPTGKDPPPISEDRMGRMERVPHPWPEARLPVLSEGTGARSWCRRRRSSGANS